MVIEIKNNTLGEKVQNLLSLYNHASTAQLDALLLTASEDSTPEQRKAQDDHAQEMVAGIEQIEKLIQELTAKAEDHNRPARQ
jgi:hypothetical protein